MDSESTLIDLQVSKMAEELQGSEIIKLAGEIRAKIAQGHQIFNFTIGDFNPDIFPIPELLTKMIQNEYEKGSTNYPAANGMAELRQSIVDNIISKLDLNYPADQVLIAGGARPLIYATFQAIVDPGDSVIFPVPSWNNNHYTHLTRGTGIFVETTAENNFMPVAADLEPHIQEASLIALCSPLNPTGTVFSKEQLTDICELMVSENDRRAGIGMKPVYLMFDQIYWQLTYGDTEHCHPVNLVPAVEPFTIYIDGLSKAYAATGVRVGWSFGPSKVINKMRAILSHIGAWAPKAEQLATAKYLNQTEAVDQYIAWIKQESDDRLQAFYRGFCELEGQGFPVKAIAPQAAIYLTIWADLVGKRTADGTLIENTKDVTSYLLDEAGLAVVPFYAFGASVESRWYRLSIGTSDKSQIPAVFSRLGAALQALS